MRSKLTRKQKINRPDVYPQSRAHIHLNNNLMCAIDIKTTGPNPFYHEIYEFCVLIIASDGTPYFEILPFYTQFKPLHLDRIRFDERMGIKTRDRINNAINTGIDYGKAIDHFDEWYDKLNMKFRKKIFPIAFNWPLINAFLYQWLGFIHMNSIFSYQFRDILAEANFINDYFDFHNYRIPFAKTDYSYILNCCKLEHEMGNWDTLENCRNIAEVHRLMCRDTLFNIDLNDEFEPDDTLEHMQTNDQANPE